MGFGVASAVWSHRLTDRSPSLDCCAP